MRGGAERVHDVLDPAPSYPSPQPSPYGRGGAARFTPYGRTNQPETVERRVRGFQRVLTLWRGPGAEPRVGTSAPAKPGWRFQMQGSTLHPPKVSTFGIQDRAPHRPRPARSRRRSARRRRAAACRLPVGRRSAEVGEARHPVLAHPAGHDAGKVREVRLDVEADAVEAHPAAHPDADRRDLVLDARTLLRPPHPDADPVLAPLSAHVEGVQRRDQPRLQAGHVGAQVRAAAVEVEHHVGHPLARP